ncbi:hypothetical protein PROP_02163 [Propionicimonas sp. T2.31MG-18]|uniref:AAA family ATPase n=1 Tax=Propionicimonas sp. T2.31MG-18 TaxID=3157620 RepID=UPI0035EB77D6
MAPTAVSSWQQAVDELLGRLAEGSRLVLIDGPSGSGKSTLATLLHQRASQAEPATRLVRLDDVYPGWDGLADGAREVAEDLVAPLAAGRAGRYRRYDWAAGMKTDAIEIEPGVPVIVEGVGALHPLSTPLASGRAWVTAAPRERRRRALNRDGDTYRPHWDRWAAQETAFYADTRPAARADLVLNTTRTRILEAPDD